MSVTSVLSPVRNAVGRVLFGADGRLRATYRVFLPVVLFVITIVVGTLAADLTLGQDHEYAVSVIKSVSLVLLVPMLWATTRYLERRTIGDYGFTLSARWFAKAAFGTLVAAFILATTFGISHLSGTLRVKDVPVLEDPSVIVTVLVASYLTHVLTGIAEETVFRGAVATNAAEGLRSRSLSPRTAILGAGVFSGVFFGLFHLPFYSDMPPGAPFGFLFLGTGIGVLLGLVYVVTGDLAVPIGIHAGFNALSNSVFLADEAPALVLIEFTGSGVMFPTAVPFVASLVLAGVLVFGTIYWRDGGLSLSESLLQGPTRTAE